MEGYFTTNYDEAIEKAYRENKSALQKIEKLLVTMIHCKSSSES